MGNGIADLVRDPPSNRTVSPETEHDVLAVEPRPDCNGRRESPLLIETLQHVSQMARRQRVLSLRDVGKLEGTVNSGVSGSCSLEETRSLIRWSDQDIRIRQGLSTLRVHQSATDAVFGCRRGLRTHLREWHSGKREYERDSPKMPHGSASTA
jgi:hypothetical protein